MFFWIFYIPIKECIPLTLKDLDASLLRVTIKRWAYLNKVSPEWLLQVQIIQKSTLFWRKPQEPLVHGRSGNYLALRFLALSMRGHVFQQLLQNTRNCVFSSSDRMSDLLGSFNKQKSTYQEGWCLHKNPETDSE